MFRLRLPTAACALALWVTCLVPAAPAQAQISFRAAAVAAPGADITHIGAGAAAVRDSTSCGSISPAIPAGNVDDLLIALVNVREDNANVATPAGWTLLYNATYPGGQDFKVFMYYRVATGSDALTVTATNTCNSMAGRVSRFRDVDTAQPFLNVPIPGANVVMQNSNNIDTGTETTVDPNAMLVVASFVANNVTTTEGAGWSASFESVHNLNNRDITLNLHYLLQTTAGAKSVSNWPLSSTENNIGIIFSLRPASAGLRIPKPAGTLQDDVMIASIAVRPPAPTPSPDIIHVGAAAPAVNESGCPRSITLPIPGGNIDDLLIAQVIVREDSATVTASAGWTPLYGATYSPVGQEFRAFLYYRVATGSDALTVTQSGTCNTMGGQISRFRNVDTSQPFLNVPIPGANVVMQGSNNIDTGTETTVDANAMLVVASFVNDDLGIAQGAGWSASYESAGNLNRDAAIHLHYQLQTTAGAKSIADWPLGAFAANIGVIFSLRPLPATQPSVTITAPAGWTLVNRTDNTNANANSLAVYMKVAGAAEPADYTWGLTSTTGATGGIQSFIGVDTSSPIDVQNGQTTPSGLAHATPSVTTTVAGAMLVSSHAFSSAATWTSPAGMTQGFTASSIATPNAAGISLQCNYVFQASAGATGAKTATAGNDADVGNGHLLALRPAVPPVPTPGAFNAFETSTTAGAIVGVIRTKIAGSGFSLDVVAIAGGAQQAGFTDAVMVELLGNNTLGVSLDAQNCPSSFSLVQTVAPDPMITGGRSTVNFAAVADSWRDVRVRVRWPTSSPTVTWCSTDNFAIRPNSFASFAVSDNDWQTAGTGRSLNDVSFGSVIHKAGRPVSARASAVNAAGTPAVTTNYAGTPSATLSACAGAACTASFGTLTLNSAFAAGELAADAASYDNVGSFRVQLVDSTFASVDASDGSTAAERNIASSTIDVGRFVPDHFAVSLNTPVFGTACGSFGYVGQSFAYATAPVITVTAQNFANNTTSLYAGSWWRITNTSVTPNSQAARYSAATANTLDVSVLPPVGSDPAVADGGGGVGTLTFGSGGGIAFSRSAAVAPFDADVALSINVIDADGVAFAANPAAFGVAAPGSGIAFSAGKEQRFGRLRLDNAFGSGNTNLPIPIRTQYWTGTAFQTNNGDNCTSLAAANVGFSGYSGGITAVNMNSSNISGLGAPFASGVGSFTLTKPLPAPASPGAVTLTIDLAAEAKSYLQGNWGVPTYTADPTSRAAFGLYGSQPDNFIFFRENY